MAFTKNELDLSQLTWEDCWVRKARSRKHDPVEAEEVWVESKEGRSEETGWNGGESKRQAYNYPATQNRPYGLICVINREFGDFCWFFWNQLICSEVELRGQAQDSWPWPCVSETSRVIPNRPLSPEGQPAGRPRCQLSLQGRGGEKDRTGGQRENWVRHYCYHKRF